MPCSRLVTVLITVFWEVRKPDVSLSSDKDTHVRLNHPGPAEDGSLILTSIYFVDPRSLAW